MNQNIVREWYEDKKNVDEMIHWNKGKLKIWEEKVLSYFPAGGAVLDVGCGLGREAFALCEKGYKVTGIDISESVINEVIQLVKNNRYNIPFLHYNGKDIPFEDSSYDIVIIWAQTFGLIYEDADKRYFLKECRRVLKDGGILSFSGHDYEFEIENYKNYMEGRKFFAYANTQMYWETFLPEELEAFAKEAGYKIIVCERGEIYKPEDGVILHCLCMK